MFSRKANAQEVDKIFAEEADCDENLFNFILRYSTSEIIKLIY